MIHKQHVHTRKSSQRTSEIHKEDQIKLVSVAMPRLCCHAYAKRNKLFHLIMQHLSCKVILKKTRMALTKIRKVYRFAKISFGTEKLREHRWEKYQKYVCAFLYFCTAFLFASSFVGIFMHEDDLAMKIQSLIFFVVLFIAMTFILIFLKYSEASEELWDWCENLEAEYPNFECIQECKQKFEDAFEFIVYGMIFGTFVLMHLQTCFNLYQGVLLTSAFTPAPFGNYWAFFVVHLLQSFGSFLMTIPASFVLATIFVMQNYFVTAFECMKQIIQLRLTSPEMNDKIFTSIIKEAVDLHSNIIDHQKLLENFAYYPILIWECLTYGFLLLVWVAVFFFHEAIMFVCVESGYTLIYIIFCWTNERLDDAYDDTGDALYGLEWYKMSPRQRRVIQTVIGMLQRRRFLKAGPFEVLSFEHFTTMLDEVYSYGLVINNLVVLN